MDRNKFYDPTKTGKEGGFSWRPATGIGEIIGGRRDIRKALGIQEDEEDIVGEDQIEDNEDWDDDGEDWEDEED